MDLYGPVWLCFTWFSAHSDLIYGYFFYKMHNFPEDDDVDENNSVENAADDVIFYYAKKRKTLFVYDRGKLTKYVFVPCVRI